MPVTQFNFVAGEDRYEVDLPPGFDLIEAMSTVGLAGSVRQLVFRADPREDPATRPYLAHIRDGTSPNGLPVSVYERSEAPPVQVLVWRLRRGLLVTNFDAEAAGQLDRYVEGIRVEDGDIPHVSYGPPLQPGDPREPVERDQNTFRAKNDRADQVITISRLPAARRAERPPMLPPEWAIQTADTDAGLMVSWGGSASHAPEIESSIGAVAQSVRRVE